jgi:signal peptidase I
MNVAKKLLDFLMDILETITFVGSIFVVVYLFIMQPNQVKGPSMLPTFESGEYIFTSKVTYKFRPMERGDVVVFRSPKNPDQEYIKRIIGLPGDQVRIDTGRVYVNEKQVNESYISSTTTLFEGGALLNNVPITVGDDELFVMGDNRPHSSDSREFGPIQTSSLIGQVFYRYYPTTRMGNITNPLKSQFVKQASSLLAPLLEVRISALRA